MRNARSRRDVEDQLTDGVKAAFDANGIEIPFPKRDIYVRNVSETPPESGLAK